MYLFGASGHGKVIAEIAEQNQLKIDAFIDNNRNLNKILNYKVLHEIPNQLGKMTIAIGNNTIRKKIANEMVQFEFVTLIHPKATTSTSASIKEGSVVMAGATINAETVIGKHCIINTNASIDHECIISDFVHISPNVALAGNVQVGEGTHIGIGACVIQGIKIGKWCTIGAGAIIINDIPDKVTVVGNPGKIIKFHTE